MNDPRVNGWHQFNVGEALAKAALKEQEKAQREADDDTEGRTE